MTKFVVIDSIDTVIIEENETRYIQINDIIPKKIICAGTLILKNNLDQDTENSFKIQLLAKAKFRLETGSSLYGIEALLNRSNINDIEIEIYGYNFVISKDQKAFDLQPLWHLNKQEIDLLCDFIKNNNIQASPAKIKMTYRNNYETFNQLFENILSKEHLNKVNNEFCGTRIDCSDRKQSLFISISDQDLANIPAEIKAKLLGLSLFDEKDENIDH